MLETHPVLCSNAENRMYGGIAKIFIEQEETFTEISTMLTGQVTFSSVRSVISKALILLNVCFKLPLTVAGGVYS